MALFSRLYGRRTKISAEEVRGSSLADRRIRIGFVVPPAPSFAGIERAVHTTANALALEHGDAFAVHVISGSKHRELEVEAVHYRLHHLHASRLRHVVGRLRSCLDRHAFDVLVPAQCEMSALTYVAARTSRLNRRASLITHLHGNPAIEERKSAINRALFAFYKAVVAPQVAATFTVSEALVKTVRGSALAGGNPVYYAPNPVRAFAETGTLREAGDPPRFVSVGRLTRQKGHDVLLAAFAEVLLVRPDALLDIVGSGEDEADLKALATRLGLGERARFHGYVSDPSNLMRRASAFALASRWEGYPLALIEAQSVGLPLVAADCQTGPAEIVDQPWIGRLAPVGDAAAFAHAMLDALTITRDSTEDDRRRARAGQSAPSAIARIHRDLLESVVARQQQACMSGSPWFDTAPHSSDRQTIRKAGATLKSDDHVHAVGSIRADDAVI